MKTITFYQVNPSNNKKFIIDEFNSIDEIYEQFDQCQELEDLIIFLTNIFVNDGSGKDVNAFDYIVKNIIKKRNKNIKL